MWFYKICFIFIILRSICVKSQFQFGQTLQQINPFNILNPFGFRPPVNSNNNQQTYNQYITSTRAPNRVSDIVYPSYNIPSYNNPTYSNPTTKKPQFIQNLRISDQKCLEYLNRAKNSVLVGSLSFVPTVQGIQTDQCDASQGLIIGGENAKPGEFPHMAALGYRNLDEINFQCGGSLISDRYILTAAHCRVANRVRPSVARLGDLNLHVKESNIPELNVPIEKFISHEQYDATSSKNDIAVVKLDRVVSFGKFIRPACLTNKFPTNKRAVASGWGLTEALSDKTSDIMQKVELDIIDLSQCNQFYDNNLDNTQICAGELAGGKDTCQGDSGGPLQAISDKNKCIYNIIGITSYGNIYCGSANSPGVYTRVAAYIDWIEQKVWA